jgi:hypothetical protein
MTWVLAHEPAALPLFNIAIGESVTEVPAHCEHDHLPRETGSQRTPISAGGPDEHGSCGACAEHAERRLPSMQQSLA